MFELTGKVAIVTGSARGIGQAIAGVFAKQGAKVVIADLPSVSPDETIQLCKDNGCNDVYFHELDVTNLDSIHALVDDVVAKYGRIDILASNAGINKPMPAEQVTEDAWDAVIDINLKGSFFMAQAVYPIMKEQHYGRIIFTSSQAGVVARDNQQAYCASKAGIISMARAFAFDWAKDGITVNSVAPCFALTALTKTRLEDPVYGKMILDMIPIGRLVNPEEIGAGFTFLASDEAAMVTGQTLVMDGGWTIW